MTQTIVTEPMAPLWEAPYPGALLCDELLCGTRATILQQGQGSWVYIRAAHGYQGWGREEHFLQSSARVDSWLRKEKLLVLAGCVDLQRDPRVRATAVATLGRGCLVAPLGGPLGGPLGNWQPVCLPGGQEGYLPTVHLAPYPLGQGMGQQELRAHICQTARSYLGCCYRWGGKTPLGLDCSGLTSQLYLLYGYTLWRDSDPREGYASHPIAKEQLRPADLLYWKGHIALYLGDGCYLHSNATGGGVSVNSLDPAHPAYRPDLAESILGYGSVF